LEIKALNYGLPGTKVIIQLIELVLPNIWGCLGLGFFPAFDLALYSFAKLFSLNKVPSVLVHNHDCSFSHLNITQNFHHLTRLSGINMLLDHSSTASGDVSKNCIMFLHVFLLKY